MRKNKLSFSAGLLVFAMVVIFLNGANVRRSAVRRKADPMPKGMPWYEGMFADGMIRIAVFWGWDHPRETIMNTFPAFETLNGKTLYYKGKPVKIEIGMITQVNDKPKEIFRNALEDPTIDLILYSGHARFGQGMAFESKNDVFRSGRGDLIEDRHESPAKVVRATSNDIDTVNFPQSYKIIMINACDSESHFRESWTRRFKECQAPIDLVTVEYPVFNLYDDRRVLNFLRDLLAFSDWKTIKENYDSEIYRRRNRLVVSPVYSPSDNELAADYH